MLWCRTHACGSIKIMLINNMYKNGCNLSETNTTLEWQSHIFAWKCRIQVVSTFRVNMSWCMSIVMTFQYIGIFEKNWKKIVFCMMKLYISSTFELFNFHDFTSTFFLIIHKLKKKKITSEFISCTYLAVYTYIRPLACTS